ncbi:hypothetical protein GPECTOR_62g909 [Gonium pectorale]|uniref:Uncharacterized protein n=1 Tax=Gonium pectorale TaxID=33097 RepID=A0A150G4P4_GONPE|nr:hypothetical protein GPECTOR_62g909 [Gonium pectorale]|eukprot:KXZ44794.1 hypothetical protein GPECTOR_62g909 [Gonium pectorale]
MGPAEAATGLWVHPGRSEGPPAAFGGPHAADASTAPEEGAAEPSGPAADRASGAAAAAQQVPPAAAAVATEPGGQGRVEGLERLAASSGGDVAAPMDEGEDEGRVGEGIAGGLEAVAEAGEAAMRDAELVGGEEGAAAAAAADAAGADATVDGRIPEDEEGGEPVPRGRHDGHGGGGGGGGGGGSGGRRVTDAAAEWARGEDSGEAEEVAQEPEAAEAEEAVEAGDGCGGGGPDGNGDDEEVTESVVQGEDEASADTETDGAEEGSGGRNGRQAQAAHSGGALAAVPGNPAAGAAAAGSARRRGGGGDLVGPVGPGAIHPSAAASPAADGAVAVLCNHLGGAFLLRHHLVACLCASCRNVPGGGLRGCWTPIGFEQHAGMRSSKKWKNSIRLRVLPPQAAAAAVVSGGAAASTAPVAGGKAVALLADPSQGGGVAGSSLGAWLDRHGVEVAPSKERRRDMPADEVERCLKAAAAVTGGWGAAKGGKGLPPAIESASPEQEQDETGAPDGEFRIQGQGYQVLRCGDPPGYEVFCLIPGYQLSEVSVRAFDCGKLVIRAEPSDAGRAALWGMTPICHLIQLPRRVRAVSAQALMTLHGQLYVRLNDN